MSTMSDDEKLEFEKAFDPANEVEGSRREHLSLSRRYKLVVQSYGTSPGTWSYTSGTVYRRGTDADDIVFVDDSGKWVPIATVRRNYSAFPFLFVEDHPKSDFLVCGHDYQGQTVVDLKTGARKDALSPGTEDGHGFCWSEHRFDAATCTLVVCGCHWAFPYEYRLYDFSDPMSGWPGDPAHGRRRVSSRRHRHGGGRGVAEVQRSDHPLLPVRRRPR